MRPVHRFRIANDLPLPAEVDGIIKHHAAPEAAIERRSVQLPLGPWTWIAT
jgi:hypothetical protein